MWFVNRGTTWTVAWRDKVSRRCRGDNRDRRNIVVEFGRGYISIGDVWRNINVGRGVPVRAGAQKA